MIGAHLIVLQVVIPLMAAPACLILRRSNLAWMFTVAVSLLALAMATTLLGQVQANGPISYAIGNWAPPWGIEYRIDAVGSYVLLIVAAIGAVISIYARPSVAREISGDRIYLFYTAYLLCLTGLTGMTVTGDAFNLFVFLEISSLSSYVLIALGRDRRALTASYSYLILGTIGATFYVIGLGLLYMMTGTLNMMDLAERLPEVAATRTVLVALGFLTVGLCLKLALFPLHLWLPNAYTYAPSAVTAFLAATATKVGVYVLLRVFFTIFGPSKLFLTEPALPAILMTLSIAGIFAASTVAVFQGNIKRMLAYSSVAQIGYIILGVSFISETGLTAGIVHLFNHAVMKCALFMALGCVAWRMNAVRIENFQGLGKSMPLTMGAFVLAGLSLIGLPGTVGFISKWYLIKAAFEADMWPIALLIPLSSLLAVIYIGRVIEMAYFRPVPAGSQRSGVEAPALMIVPTWAMALAVVYFGLDTDLTLGVAQTAAQTLMGAMQ